MPAKEELAAISKDPPVVLDAAYAEHLERLATGAMQGAPEVADRLMQEVERATVLPSSEVPSNVVNIGSEVTFRDDTAGRVTSLVLVLPQNADITERRVSVLTPIGAALIGLAEGASITWETRGGETRQLTVTKVMAPGAADTQKEPIGS